VWVADASSGVLRRFRASGALIGVVPAPDSSAVAYTTLASDPSGFVAAGDAAGQRVRVFAPDGTLVFERVLGSPRAPWRPTSIAWSARDRIAVVDGARGEVVILEVGRAAATGSGTTGEGKP